MTKKAKQFSVTGKAMWARVFEDNRDMEGWEGSYEWCDGAYTIDVCLDDDNYRTFIDSGTARQGKKDKYGDFILDGDGNKIVKFDRKHKGPFAKAGGPPKVLWKDGTPYDFEAEGSIGNGSIVELHFEVYPTVKVPGTRLTKVVVLDHVVYEPDVEEDDEDEIPF